MKKKGFTLIELLVVIAILAILATVSIIGYSSFIGRANESNCLTEATQIRELFIAEDINNDYMKIITKEGEDKGKIEFAYIKVEKSVIDANNFGQYYKKNDDGYTVLTAKPEDNSTDNYFKLYTIEDIKKDLKDDINLGSAKLELDNSGGAANKGFLKYTSKDGNYYAIIKFDNSEIKVQEVNSAN